MSTELEEFKAAFAEWRASEQGCKTMRLDPDVIARVAFLVGAHRGIGFARAALVATTTINDASEP